MFKTESFGHLDLDIGIYLEFGFWDLEFPMRSIGETSPEVTSSCFAEFLNEGSPVRLRLLAQSTCVGFKYGSLTFNLRDFSWKLARLTSPGKPEFAVFLGLMFHGFTCGTSLKHGLQSNKKLNLLSSVIPSKSEGGPEY